MIFYRYEASLTCVMSMLDPLKSTKHLEFNNCISRLWIILNLLSRISRFVGSKRFLCVSCNLLLDLPYFTNQTAVSFIREHQARGEKVYVHCRAGHGRSAAAVFAWLLYEDPIVDIVKLNAKLCGLRNVRAGLWKQPNIQEFHSWLKLGGVLGNGRPADSGGQFATILYDRDEDEESDREF